MMKRANRAGLPHDERSIFHHNWEQKIISNALGSYAETGRYSVLYVISIQFGIPQRENV
jgi:hypothetical protein